MQNMSVKKPYFSTDHRMEKFWLAFAWLISIICLGLLILFWEQTRSMNLINYLQKFRSTKFIEFFFQFWTFLGDDKFYMIFFGIIIWCVNKSLGFKGVSILLISGLVSWLTKGAFLLERPFLPGMIQLESAAFPSGHTLTAVTVWGFMAVLIKKKWFWLWSIAAMVFTPFSRIILGYHYPGDILGGYALGIIFLLAFLGVSNYLYHHNLSIKLTKRGLFLISILLPLIISAIGFMSEAPKLMGLLMGASLGYSLEKEKIKANPRTKLFFQFLKASLGLIVLFAIIIGLSPILTSTNLVALAVFRFLRYALAGFWATFLAPALFVIIKLTPREEQ